MTAGLIPCPVCNGGYSPCTRCLGVGFALSDGSVLTDQEIVRIALNNEHINGNPFPVYAVGAAFNRLLKYADDNDYSPAYQDEYQRLWHNAREQVETLEALVAKRHFVKGKYVCRYCWRADGHTEDCEAIAALGRHP